MLVVTSLRLCSAAQTLPPPWSTWGVGVLHPPPHSTSGLVEWGHRRAALTHFRLEWSQGESDLLSSPLGECPSAGLGTPVCIMGRFVAPCRPSRLCRDIHTVGSSGAPGILQHALPFRGP